LSLSIFQSFGPSCNFGLDSVFAHVVVSRCNDAR
jgi:hypothetical protein